MKNGLSNVAFFFFPIFAGALFLEFIGLNYIQAFFAGLGFAIVSGIILIGTIVSYYTWPARRYKDAITEVGGYHMHIALWLDLLLFEFVMFTALIFNWDVRNSPGGSADPVVVDYAIYRPFLDYVHWRVILWLAIAFTPIHIGLSYQARTAMGMISKRYDMLADKKQI